MPPQPLPQAQAICSAIFTLNKELSRLDTIGAGLAAIHVNAAIEQLRVNLAIVNDNGASLYDRELLCLVRDGISSQGQSALPYRD
ncbi:hypothetical protein ACI5KX_09450 [Erythrobacter sp. GH1-10]|uniref:hypothetical protein n=1 Tax=Erythrobacter sp. GH1-10 TaxID=3349334 RepID=UPI003877BA13